ncbi:MAG: transporter substrate-binding domain-containing protein [Desulfobacterales bacterium]|nr:transporter substrate-binding domain-containing protein [Desulfobacterales bacterium]
MKLGFRFLYVCFFILFTIAHSFGDDIVLVSDIWCPINCEPNSSEPGYMIEIAQSAFNKAGHKVIYKILPWARAVKETRNAMYTGVIGPYVEDVPDFVFPENELGMIGFSIFVSKDNTWKYDGIKSLTSISLGVIRDYEYDETINTYIDNNLSEMNKIQMASGDNALEININKLDKGRIDAVIENSIIFLYTANKLGIKDRFISAGVAVEPKKVYIAFSPANPKSKEYAKILSDGVEALRKSGELVKILKKYGLKDWK